MASAVNLSFPLERVVAQLPVEGGQGEVAERVHKGLVDLVRILAKACQVLAPRLTERLRQDVLDRQIGVFEVDAFWMTVALLKSLEDELSLRATAAEVELASPDCLAELLVTWPVTPLAGQFPPQRLREGRILRQLAHKLDEQSVKRVSTDKAAGYRSAA